MSLIDLQQQSIEGDVSEQSKTVKIPRRIGRSLPHLSMAWIGGHCFPYRHKIQVALTLVFVVSVVQFGPEMN
jgi:hypothetical protein